MTFPENMPQGIRKLLGDKSCETDTVGMSQAGVYLFPDWVLKVQDLSEESQNEYDMLSWLRDKLPVPGVLARETQDGKDFLLMERCPGEMACAERYLDDPVTLAGLLANTLKALWAVDVGDCPCDQSLDRKLEQAAYNVENGLVDVDNVEPDTFGPNGFHDPADLLRWLKTHRPPEETALIHGDFCLPNLFGMGDRPAGLIDLGRGGAGDPWCDIALCYRSLDHNYKGAYGGHPRPDFDPDILFQALGMAPNWEKIRYYILLDELF